MSTRFVGRQNWTVRTTMRRYTRLSNGFSRKIENRMAAVALNYFAYNCKIHTSLRVTPAMAKRKNDDTPVPPIAASVEDIMKALLATPPPPAGHPSTRKKPPVAKKGTKRR